MTIIPMIIYTIILYPMVLLIIIPMKNGYFIGNVPNIFRQTHMTIIIYPQAIGVNLRSSSSEAPGGGGLVLESQPWLMADVQM